MVGAQTESFQSSLSHHLPRGSDTDSEETDAVSEETLDKMKIPRLRAAGRSPMNEAPWPAQALGQAGARLPEGEAEPEEHIAPQAQGELNCQHEPQQVPNKQLIHIALTCGG